MNKIKYILALGILFVTLSVNAQNQNDMRLNEALVVNINDFQDDFGQHSPWIELFNTSYGTVDIAGCFLTNDPNDLRKYSIPKGDVLTKVKPRQHILFWADNNPKRGTFHINFEIKAGDEILFIASDGRTIIDKFIIPTELADNTSYGRIDDGIGTKADEFDPQYWKILDHTSPSTNNTVQDGITKAMVMKSQDPYGIIMALTAMSVVFLALVILYIIFKLIGKTSVKQQQKKANKSAVSGKAIAVTETSTECFAAIAMALHLYDEENASHDDESLTITMSHTDRTYSPWSSKIYGLRQAPHIKKN